MTKDGVALSETRPPLPVIALDASALRGDGYLSEFRLRQLQAFALETEAIILIPKVVVHEVHGLLADQVSKAVGDVAKANQTLRMAGSAVTVPGLDEAATTDECCSAFDARVRKLGASVVELPTFQTGDVLDRIQRRRRPFADSGAGRDRGFKDFVLWTSIVDHISLLATRLKRPIELLLVTANTQDFERDGSLHPDLQADFHDGPITASLYTSMDDFARHRLLPQTGPIAELASRMDELKLESSVREFAEECLWDQLDGREPDELDSSDIDGGLREVQLRGIHDIEILPGVGVYAVDENAAYAEVEMEFGIDVRGERPYMEVDWDADRREWSPFRESTFRGTAYGYVLGEVTLEREEDELVPVSLYVSRFSIRVKA